MSAAASTTTMRFCSFTFIGFPHFDLFLSLSLTLSFIKSIKNANDGSFQFTRISRIHKSSTMCIRFELRLFHCHWLCSMCVCRSSRLSSNSCEQMYVYYFFIIYLSSIVLSTDTQARHTTHAHAHLLNVESRKWLHRRDKRKQLN